MPLFEPMRRAPADRYGGLRYDPQRRGGEGHVESYFLKINDPAERRALWIKATVYAPRHAAGGAVAEAWAVAFEHGKEHVAVKASYPFGDARFARDRLDVHVSDALHLRPETTRGTVASGGRAIAWELALDGDASPLTLLPAAWMYDAAFPREKLVSPVPHLAANGVVTVNGARWDVRGWRGLLGHNWGRGHAPLYAWGHCNVWDEASANDDALVVEGVSASLVAGRKVTSLALRHRGARFDLTSPRDLVCARSEISPRRWKFETARHDVAVRGELWAETDDFVGLFYPNPDGTMTHCLNSKIAHARLEIALPHCPPFVARSRAAALEIGTLDPHHGVRMYV